MAINISVPTNQETPEMKPKITVFGVGGAGGNAVNNMIQAALEGVDFVVANTDSQALGQSKAERRIQLGLTITEGLGAGSRPDVGRAAAEEALEQIVEVLTGANMAFITAGMGGGTGTGAAPVIARSAREQGILTVGVVTKPFHFEGTHRMRIAEEGIRELEQYVDTLIIIPNQNLFRVANEKTTFADAFKMADDVLYSGVRGVTDLMVMPGLINLDFADIRTVMSEMGKALMGTGEAEGERRALDAAEAAIANPLLEDISMGGATGVIINISGGQDMTLFEVDEAANRIRSEVDADAQIILGSTFDESLEGRIRVSIVATGMDREAAAKPTPALIDVAAWRGRTTMALERPKAASAKVVAMHPMQAESALAQAPETRPLAEGEGDDEPASAVAAEAESEVASLAEAALIALADTAMSDTGTAIAGTRMEPQETAAPLASTGDPFIPPPPVEPARAESRAAAAEPFAAAALANGAAEPAPRTVTKGPSLFERVTGTGRAAKAARAAKAQAQAETAAATASPRSDAAGPGEQSRIGGLDPADRIAGSQAEEDLLDIPAFLRRQAN